MSVQHDDSLGTEVGSVTVSVPATGCYEDVISTFDPHAPKLYEAFHRLNHLCFDNRVPELPLLTVVTFPYGHCIGQTHYRDDKLPRIEIKRSLARHDDFEEVVLHEMLHAYLRLGGEDSSHNGRPWSREVERITPLYLGVQVRATPQKLKRINGKPTRWTPEGYLTRRELASWPHSVVHTQLRVTPYGDRP